MGNCILTKGNEKQCNSMKQNLSRLNPNTTVQNSIGNYVLPKSSRLWVDYGKELKPEIKEKNLILHQEWGTSYKIILEPLHYPNLVLPNKEKLNFMATHRLTNFLAPPKSLIGTPLPNVNIHLTYIQNDGSNEIYATIGDDLWTGSKAMKNGISLNGGYFIVNYNVENPLTSYLTEEDLMNPLGYFYNNGVGNTIIPTMPPYNKDFAVVTVTSDNKVKMYRQEEFLSKHKTTTRDILVYCCDKNQKTIENKVACFSIPIVDINPKTNKPVKSKIDYKIAFETGPILIWDGEIVFTRKKMMNDMFIMKDLINEYPQGDPEWRLPSDFEVVDNPLKYPYYKLQPEEENCFAYNNNDGEYAFYSDQRSSSSFHVTHVLCITYDDKVISILVEGRVFTGLGVDRAQLASLVSLFNVKYAVALDGGFSANVLYTEKKNHKYILQDPEKRPLGIALHFNQGA